MALHAFGWNDPAPAAVTGSAVTIGNFDGVHLGHRALAAMCVARAREANIPAIAVTFDPPPQALLNPATAKPPLTTLVERARLLHAAGIDQVVAYRADAALLALSAEAFFEDVIRGQFQARAVIEGYDFRFGRGRSGDTNLLNSMCAMHGLTFDEVRPVPVNGEAVSSSRIRLALQSGDLETAHALLGHPYRLTGVVVAGARRGRTIGVPTANLDRIETLIPETGVYAVRAWVGPQSYAAAANIGPNPTFGEDARKVEVHLIGFDGDLYGQTLTIEMLTRLRGTQPFPDVETLKLQIARDLEDARRIASGP